MIQDIVDSLAENALDYLLLAGEMAKESSPRKLKHAVATLSDGIELLLKARLAVYDWSLIFEDVDKAKRKDLKSGEFKSVAYHQSIGRLANICSVEIDKKHLDTINNIRNLRNKIRHFSVIVTKEEATTILAETYSFAIDFTTNHLEEHLGEASDILADLRHLLGEFEAFIDERMRNIKSDLDEQFNTLRCPQCFQLALLVDDGQTSCAFCGFKGSGVDTAEAMADRIDPGASPKERSTDPIIFPCPECAAWAFLCLDGEYHCYSCGESGDYSPCFGCGEFYIAEDHDGERCEDCWTRMLDRND